VDNSNLHKLRALHGEPHRYAANDTGDPRFRDSLLVNMMAPPSLDLKVGAQVMLIKNLSEDLVNGTLGTVVDFRTEKDFDVFSGETSLDVDSKFAKRMKVFANELESASKNKDDQLRYPVVRFHISPGVSRDILVQPNEWKVELPSGEVQASRSQIPLILAWALSIHKAQGQTLARVRVDLGKVFEKGQAYVALSRATTQEGLQVLRFSKEKVMAHAKVIAFYDKLYSVNSLLDPNKKPASITSFARGAVKPSAAAGTYGGSRGGKASREVIDLDADEEAWSAAYS
jgi:ATP-dependent DNA helicase PIF1